MSRTQSPIVALAVCSSLLLSAVPAVSGQCRAAPQGLTAARDFFIREGMGCAAWVQSIKPASEEPCGEEAGGVAAWNELGFTGQAFAYHGDVMRCGAARWHLGIGDYWTAENNCNWWRSAENYDMTKVLGQDAAGKRSGETCFDHEHFDRVKILHLSNEFDEIPGYCRNEDRIGGCANDERAAKPSRDQQIDMTKHAVARVRKKAPGVLIAAPFANLRLTWAAVDGGRRFREGCDIVQQCHRGTGFCTNEAGRPVGTERVCIETRQGGNPVVCKRFDAPSGPPPYPACPADGCASGPVTSCGRSALCVAKHCDEWGSELLEYPGHESFIHANGPEKPLVDIYMDGGLPPMCSDDGRNREWNKPNNYDDFLEKLAFVRAISRKTGIVQGFKVSLGAEACSTSPELLRFQHYASWTYGALVSRAYRYEYLFEAGDGGAMRADLKAELADVHEARDALSHALPKLVSTGVRFLPSQGRRTERPTSQLVPGANLRFAAERASGSPFKESEPSPLPSLKRIRARGDVVVGGFEVLDEALDGECKRQQYMMVTNGRVDYSGTVLPESFADGRIRLTFANRVKTVRGITGLQRLMPNGKLRFLEFEEYTPNGASKPVFRVAFRLKAGEGALFKLGQDTSQDTCFEELLKPLCPAS